MSDFPGMTDDLARLGAALYDATTEDVAREHAVAATVQRRRDVAGAGVGAVPGRGAAGGTRARRWSRRRTVLGVVAGLVIVPSVAVAAVSLISPHQVAQSMPAGTLALMGTEPHCTVVRENVEYACTLEKAPEGDIGPGNWKGTVEPTVDETKHFNGGCRSSNAEGTVWRCYIGEEAVRQQIIGDSLLGQKSEGPGVG